jgi:sulfatase maturation enzyme AslB (radical SAM superfamily)
MYSKAYSCIHIEGSLNIGTDYLTLCTSAHAMNGCSLIGKFSGNALPIDMIVEKRERLRALNNGRPNASPCFGCPELVWRHWPPKPYLFDSLTINDFKECNLRCDYCHRTEMDRSQVQTIRTHELLPIIRDMVEKGYLSSHASINWGGGEVALYRDFEPVATYFTKRGFRQFVNTNATIHSKAIEAGMKTGLMDVQVSVDSGTKETYRVVKGRDAFEAVWANISRYAAVGPIAIKYIVMEKNAGRGEIDNFISMCRAAGIAQIIAAPENNQFANNEIPTDTIRSVAYMIHQARKAGIRVNERAVRFGDVYGKQIRSFLLDLETTKSGRWLLMLRFLLLELRSKGGRLLTNLESQTFFPRPLTRLLAFHK